MWAASGTLAIQLAILSKQEAICQCGRSLSYALNAGAGGRARTDDLLFTKRRGIFFGICLALTLVIVGHYSAEPDAARSVSIYQIPPYFYVHFYPQIGGAA
jgi:hypothetical protein